VWGANANATRASALLGPAALANNSFLWRFATGGAVDSSPSVAASGAVYVGSDDGKLYAVNGSTGALLWSTPAALGPIRSSPALASNGKVYVGSLDTKLAAFDAATGASLWGFITGAAIRSSPAVSGGRVFVANDAAVVFAAIERAWLDFAPMHAHVVLTVTVSANSPSLAR
jgi:outer membrane protein assembly factor BamB